MITTAQNRVQSIRLTSDILERSGFTKKRNLDFNSFEAYDYSLSGFTVFNTIQGDFKLGNYGNQTKEIRYVHQLQELYLVLTGKEVKIMS